MRISEIERRALFTLYNWPSLALELAQRRGSRNLVLGLLHLSQLSRYASGIRNKERPRWHTQYFADRYS